MGETVEMVLMVRMVEMVETELMVLQELPVRLVLQGRLAKMLLFL